MKFYYRCDVCGHEEDAVASQMDDTNLWLCPICKRDGYCFNCDNELQNCVCYTDERALKLIRTNGGKVAAQA